MAVMKCKMCGGDLEIEEGMSVAVCEYCGTKQTVPTLDNERKTSLFGRAGRLLRACEFDKASVVFGDIVSEFPEEAEAYWGLLLCKYGVEYVDDPATGKKIPTCHRLSFESVMEDSDFEQACENADSVARGVYREEAKFLENLRKNVIEVSSKEEPYDVFICYKETDTNGDRTIDSVMAQDVYDALTEKGLRVFFARITLEDKLGMEYEPYIFAALNSAKVMLAIGTDYEYFNAVWVKNEWSRFLKLIAKGEKKVLIPCYKGIDAYDMPKEFKNLQAQDMGKLGFMQDLVRGVCKILGVEEKKEAVVEKTVVKETVVSESASKASSLLERAFIFLEDEEWESADKYFEKVLDLEPKNAMAYLGKLLADYEISTKEELRDFAEPFDDDAYYKKAIRFADEELREELEGYNRYIRERNENSRIERIYNIGCELMNSAVSVADYKKAIEKFNEILDYKEAGAKKEECFKLAEEAMKEASRRAKEKRKQELYNNARSFKNLNTINGYEKAIEQFEQISGFEDAEEQIAICKEKIEAIKEQQRAAEKKSKNLVIYNKAKEKMKDGNYLEAAQLYETISDFKGSAERKIICGELNGLIEERKRLEEEYDNTNALFKGKLKKELGVKVEETKAKIAEKTDALYRAGMEEKNYELWKNTEIGGSFILGNHYGVIKWIVLDKKGTQFLVISENAIDNSPYDSRKKNIAWQNCDLRHWLNNSFKKKAFSEEQQKMIMTTKVSTPDNDRYGTKGGDVTEDELFLLSVEEVKKYLPSREKRRCKAGSAVKKQSGGVDDSGMCWWWLRSPGVYQDCVIGVNADGGINDRGQKIYDKAYLSGAEIIVSRPVRPAMWIDLDV